MSNNTIGFCVIMAGNLVDGFTAYGPFNNSDEAIRVAQQHVVMRHEDWYVMPIVDPDSEA